MRLSSSLLSLGSPRLVGACSLVVVGCFVAAGCNAIFGIEVMEGLSGDGAGGGGAASSGGAGGSSDGGAGGGGHTNCSTDDMDFDSYSECDGDCDDTNWQINPGAFDICGDDVDNDCDDVADNGCNGQGSFVSAIIGNDANSGTQDAPLRTIAEGLLRAQTIGAGQPVIVAEGVYAEDVTLLPNHDLLGGFRCNGTDCDWARDAGMHVTDIQIQSLDGFYAGAGVGGDVEVNGLVITGPSVGVVNDALSHATIHIDGGQPFIYQNTILGPSLECSACSAAAVLVESPDGEGGGAYIKQNVITSPVVTGNGSSAGILATTDARIRVNTISGGTGRLVRGIVLINDTNTLASLIEENTVAAGQCNVAPEVDSWAIYVGSEAALVDVHQNTVNLHSVQTCGCEGSTWCGGVAMTSGDVTVRNNIILATSEPLTAAVWAGGSSEGIGDYVVHSNTLVGGGAASGLAAGIAFVLGAGASAGGGVVRNNIFLKRQESASYGLYEGSPTGKTMSPSIVENNSFSEGATPWRRWDGGDPTLIASPPQVNGEAEGENNRGGCAVNAVTYHLEAGSLCEDAGTNEGAPMTDIDGEPRPANGGYDIGADEIPD